MQRLVATLIETLGVIFVLAGIGMMSIPCATILSGVFLFLSARGLTA